MKFKYVVTAQLGDDYYDSVLVEELNAYNAVVEGSSRLGCTLADVVSVVRIG